MQIPQHAGESRPIGDSPLRWSGSLNRAGEFVRGIILRTVRLNVGPQPVLVAPMHSTSIGTSTDSSLGAFPRCVLTQRSPVCRGLVSDLDPASMAILWGPVRIPQHIILRYESVAESLLDAPSALSRASLIVESAPPSSATSYNHSPMSIGNQPNVTDKPFPPSSEYSVRRWAGLASQRQLC